MCASSESSGETLKMRRLIGFVVTNSHVLTDKYIYKHASSLRYLILASVAHLRKRLLKLKVVGVLEVRQG